MRCAEVIEQLLVGSRLLKRVELLPLQILDQRIPEQVIVRGTPDDSRDVRQPGSLTGPPAPLAHDDLVVSRHDGTDDDWLQQAHCADRVSQLFERVLVEYLARLAGVRRD